MSDPTYTVTWTTTTETTYRAVFNASELVEAGLIDHPDDVIDDVGVLIGQESDELLAGEEDTDEWEVDFSCTERVITAATVGGVHPPAYYANRGEQQP